MPRLILAPMEGLADDILRAVLTSTGAYDWCVTEFVRVTNNVLPHSSYTRLSPELNNGSRTPSGTIVRVQLLGSDPEMLAENAAHLAQLNPAGIDLNFGCPAPLVNRHRGGAALLGEPALLHDIVKAVRNAVPTHIPVTAKMRLGISDTAQALDCAQALEAGGAAELVVHARTKQDGYKPPARWEWLAKIREVVKLPLIANGEVWTVADYHGIRAVSGCDDVMIGRGAVTDPLLASRIRHSLATTNGLLKKEAEEEEEEEEEAEARQADWPQLAAMISDYWQLACIKLPEHQSPGRLKQWLGLMRSAYPQAEVLYRAIREQRTAPEVSYVLSHYGIQILKTAPVAA